GSSPSATPNGRPSGRWPQRPGAERWPQRPGAEKDGLSGQERKDGLSGPSTELIVTAGRYTGDARQRHLTRGCQVSTSVVETGEASRGLRSHVKEPEPNTNADDNVALAA